MITLRVEVNRRRVRRMLVDVCQSGYERTRGLLFRRRLCADQALLIPRCSTVHTVGLWYRLDLAFCTHDGTVLCVQRAVGPCRVARHKGACEVWEFRAGTALRLELQPGDRLVAR